MRNFKPSETDLDAEVEVRTFAGKLSTTRYKKIKKFVSRFNADTRAPYGVSPGGYPYRCGCEHDCCGCLVSERMSVEFNRLGKNNIEVKLIHSKSYNY